MALTTAFNTTIDVKELEAFGEAIGLFIHKSEELRQLVISIDITAGLARLDESALASDLSFLTGVV